MRKSGLTGIITKKHTSGPVDWWQLGIIFVALALRLYRIGSLTEFLGDQGRTMLVLYDWVHSGIVPLAGPTTLSGQHLGPFFYYLLMPGYLLSGGPIGVSVWMALLGVLATYLLYSAVRMVYGRVPALAVSALYAVAPAVVQQDRIIWEPNLVPLFAILFVWLAIRQHHHISFPTVLAQGAVCGILLQLHYPNIFFLALLGLVSFGHSVRLKHWKYIPLATVGWLIGFLVAMVPFMIYESAHGFTDIKGIVNVFVSAGSGMGKREMLMHAWEYAGRVIGKMLPHVFTPTVVVFLVGWCIFLVGHFTSWNIFWTVWFVFGVLAIARYSGVVFDHYLNFLIPAPFFMVGSVLSRVLPKLWQTAALLCVGIVVLMQLGKTDVISYGNHDVARVSAAVKLMAIEAGSTPFSFTLIKSKSFSDLHYRYFFRVSGREPAPVMSDMYQLLFLVCDEAKCPDGSVIRAKPGVPVLCYDPHCSEFYPTIPLTRDWSYVREEPIEVRGSKLGQIYVFRRRL